MTRRKRKRRPITQPGPPRAYQDSSRFAAAMQMQGKADSRKKKARHSASSIPPASKKKAHPENSGRQRQYQLPGCKSLGSGCRTLSLAKIDAKWKALITKCHILLNCCVQALSIANVEIGEIVLYCVSPLNAKRRKREEVSANRKVGKLTGTLKNM